MNKKLEKKVSTLISYILRHKPEEFDIILDNKGFALIEDIIRAVNSQYIGITKEDIEYIVKNDSKGRYEIEDNSIRALYRHSFKNIVEKKPSKPPKFLYHGTKSDVLSLILSEGLKPMNRQRLCLSSDIETAEMVGNRRKKSETVILKVRAEEAYNSGFNFYTEPNGIYMSDYIPGKFLEVLNS